MGVPFSSTSRATGFLLRAFDVDAGLRKLDERCCHVKCRFARTDFVPTLPFRYSERIRMDTSAVSANSYTHRFLMNSRLISAMLWHRSGVKERFNAGYNCMKTASSNK